MSKRTEASFDVVGGLLIKLKAKKQIHLNEVEEATKRYNAMVTELHHYRNTYGSMQQQGQEQPKVSDNGQTKVSKATERLKDLEEENVKLKRHVEELKHRLSVLAGQKLIDGNPDIADLSDPYRPTSIAEKFSQLYDDDWTEAYSVLEKTLKVEEQKIIQFLAKIVMEVDQFCFKTSTSQSSKMQLYLMDDFVSPKVELPDGEGTAVASTRAISDKHREETATRLFLNFRKSLGTLSVQPLIEIFNNYFMKRVKEACKITSSAKEIDTYVRKTIELVWMMKIQSPPMELEWKHEGDKCNKNRFTFYRKSGDTVKKTVWPALLLHKDGPLVSKGVVECL